MFDIVPALKKRGCTVSPMSPRDKILCKALRAFLKVLFRLIFLHCCVLLVFTFETGKPLRGIKITVFLIIQ